MSKFVKIALLALAAFLVLGFSVTANAGKPDKQQMIMSSPIYGELHYCSMVWLNPDTPDLERKATITLHGWASTLVWTDFVFLYDFPFAFNTFDNYSTYCKIEWVGQPSDIRATLCTTELFDVLATDPLERTGVSGCVELR